MAVNSTHPDYEASALDWSRARDVLAGEDAIKAAGEKYLARLDSQTDSDFDAYCRRASFFNATSRTAEGYVGLIFRRAPFLKLPEGRVHGTGSRAHKPRGLTAALRQFADDADMLGSTLAAYARDVAWEIMGVGRAGTLIDWEGEVENRAYASLYSAEQILNWRVNGSMAGTSRRS